MDRRQFVIASAAAAAALPRVARAAASQLNIGIIGVGMRGQVHLEELMRRPDVNIAAICDIDPFMVDKALAAVKAAGRPVPKVWTGSPEAWRAMLAKGGLDAVLIVTP
jgi:predicted dehydrogenase